MTYYDFLIRFGLSFVFSFLLGLERKAHQHTVGIRTLVLMGISTCLLSMLSIEMAAVPIVKGDPTRIAAGVITGIGFLGGGAILKQGLNIRGLTTAAIIFTTSAIGMSCGAGLILPSIITFCIAIITVLTMYKFEKKMFPAAKTKTILLMMKWEDAVRTRQEIREILQENGIIIHDMSIHLLKDAGDAELTYTAKTPDGMDAITLAEILNSRIKGLKDFKICDK